MLSIVHVLTSLNMGGAERFTIDLAYLQRQNGFNSSILSLGSPGEELEKEVVRLGIPLVTCPFSSGRFKNYQIIFQLLKKVDVIQLHSPHALRFLSPLLVMLHAKKCIYTRHGLATLDSFGYLVLHKLMRPIVDKVTFVTPAGLDVFKAVQKWPDEKLTVVENGVLIPSTDDTQGNESRNLKLGAVGRLVELKGHRNLLAAFTTCDPATSTSVISAACDIHIYGDGPLDKELREIAKHCSDEFGIVFHGSTLNRDLIYDNIDVLVVSSETEGLSMVIMEAMARSIPVIATNVGGNPKLVSNHENGLLIPYGDIDALRGAVNYLIANPPKVAEYGANAKQTMASRFSLNNTHQLYLECYNENL